MKVQQRTQDRRTGRGRAHALRSLVATLVWLVAAGCALFLALGALLVALKASPDDAAVELVTTVASRLDLGLLDPGVGLIGFDRDPHLVKATLVGWGLAALAYLLLGKLLDRLVRPSR